MKTKCFFGMVVLCMICLICSLSQGADKFYYGSYHRWWLGDYSEEYGYPFMKDSLRFNIVEDVDTSSSHIQALADNSLRAIVEGGGENSPTDWATLCHYTLWEPERYPESYHHLTYTGGWLVSDGSASGGKARLFKPGVDSAGLIQEGPAYYQEFKRSTTDSIQYTAQFRLKSPDLLPDTLIPGKGGNPPSDSLCILKVVGEKSPGVDTVLGQRVVFVSELKSLFGYYKTFPINYFATANPIEFQIYWFGKRALYVDYVKVSDDNGRLLIDDTTHYVAEQIKAFVSQEWVTNTVIPGTGETVVYRWLLRDEPRYIDAFEPGRYIDSLLRTVSMERVGNQAFNHHWDDTVKHEYLLRQNPEEYHVDIYPTSCCWGPDSSGQAFQQGVNYYTCMLNACKNDAESLGKDLWVTIQTFLDGWRVASCEFCDWHCHQYGAQWYCSYVSRLPTSNEVRLQTSLALCYGADAILNFCYYSAIDSTDPNRPLLWLGLYDHIADSTTDMWREIKNFTGIRVEKLGPTIKDLTWQGACFHDSVGDFVLRNGQPSYIDSIIGINPDSTYVQVGFFECADTAYFMLVNRKCLEGEDETLNVYFNLPDGPYFVTDQFTDSPVGKICGFTSFITVSLQPGEGKLLRLDKFISQPGYVMIVPTDYPTIQTAIDSVTNDWTTIFVEPGTYCENIDFKGKNCTLTSLFHSSGDTSYISHTIIDGSCRTSGWDSASVVRFFSGENSYAVLKGFTIRKGKGSVYLEKAQGYRLGGGIYCVNSSPIITNNIIMADTVIGLSSGKGEGGGIYCRNSSPQILNNFIKHNKANFWGGGISINQGAPIVVNNIIVNNLAEYVGGGAIYYEEVCYPLISNNTIDSNSAPRGGGIYDSASSGSEGHIVNNIISNSLQGGGIWGDSIVYLYNNDVWNNVGGNFNIWRVYGYGDTTCCSNHNGTPCDEYSNIIRNPEFVNGYHLSDSSACRNAGNTEEQLLSYDFDGNPRVRDGFVDIGAYEYQGGSFEGGAKIASGDSTSHHTQSSSQVPKALSLTQNYPNPFNPVTNIEFTVDNNSPLSFVNVKIYNIAGQLVRTLVNEEKMPGIYTVSWDGKNDSGKEVASGIYFCQLRCRNFTDTKRMVMLK